MDDGAAVAVGAGRGAVAAAALLSSLLVALPLRCAGGARRGSRPAVGRSVARGLVRCLLSREGVGSFGAAAAARGLGLRRCERGAVVPEPCRIGVRGRDAKARQGLGSG